MSNPETSDRTAPAVPEGADPPAELETLDPDRIHDLDVREQLRQGGEPFERIMSAASELPDDGVLRVRAIFEPRPLYGVMESRGFQYWTEQLGDEDWRVWFYRSGDAQSPAGRTS